VGAALQRVRRVKPFLITLPSGHAFTARAATLAEAAAQHPQAVSVVLVREVPKLTPAEAVEATREGWFW
jgi:hypothetical protein